MQITSAFNLLLDSFESATINELGDNEFPGRAGKPNPLAVHQ